MRSVSVKEESRPKKLMAQSFRVTIRTSVTLVICLFIFVHFVIALVFLLSPSEAMINNRGLNGVYKRYALPGPYFMDNLIQSSPRFFIAGKKNNTWEPWRNPEAENFKAFHENYFRYDKLKRGDFERRLARDFCKRIMKDGAKNFASYREFKILNQYLAHEYFKDGADSIRIFYTLSKYKPRERKTKVDTLFLLTYKPW